MKVIFYMTAATVALGMASGVRAQAEPDPFAPIPFRDPAPLQQLENLPDAAFAQQVTAGGGNAFRATVAQYDPPGLRLSGPVSFGFAGPKRACLEQLNVEACRLYVADLIAIHTDKQNRGATSAAPAADNAGSAATAPGVDNNPNR